MSGKSKGRMCVVAGCSKRQTDDVSVHSFPKDERQRAAWTRFVKLTRADWTGPSQYTVICSEHFNEECYEQQHFLMKDLASLGRSDWFLDRSLPFIQRGRETS